jgi:hypothetical protein
MKDWITENILQSRTAWAAILIYIAGTIAWIFALPNKDLAAVIAYFTFLGGVFGAWITKNAVQSNINNKNEAGK